MRGVGAVDAVAAKWAARSAPDAGVARARRAGVDGVPKPMGFD